jgi:hypothetical protein
MPGLLLSIYAIVAAFSTYSCMYAFRKPFTATGYDDVQDMWGLKFKSAIVIAQVLGYTLSKFIGIKVVSEMGRNKRGLGILVLIAISTVALAWVCGGACGAEIPLSLPQRHSIGHGVGPCVQLSGG